MEILVLTLLILMNGIFSMFEIALVSSRKSRLSELARQGQRGARTALALLDKPERILSAIQAGITLVGIVSGAYGGIALGEDLSPYLAFTGLEGSSRDTLAISLVVGLISYFSLVIGELVPKTLAMNHPEAISTSLAPAMRIVAAILYPVVTFLSLSTRAFLKLFHIRQGQEAPLSEEELRLLLKQGSETGVIEKEESEMINEVIRFGDKRAGDLMVHRTEVEWLDLEMTDEEILESGRLCRYSKVPVCRGQIDEIEGVVSIREWLSRLIAEPAIRLEDVLREPLYFPEQMPALRVLETFRKAKQHFGIVVNEYGGMEGIITLHDLAEAIIGELPEAHESDQPQYFIREDGSILLDGSLRIEEVEEILEMQDMRDREELHTIQTIGGLAMGRLGRIPAEGDRFQVGSYLIEIMDMDGNRVDKVLAKKSED